MARKYFRCALCGSVLNESNTLVHTLKVHPGQTVCVDPCESPQQVASSSHRAKRRKQACKPSLKASYFQAETQKKEAICPVCSGDGGVNGGCYKCENGWVSSMERKLFIPAEIRPHRSDSTRISNANYLGNNTGANYRERDGRIGSNPTHDDYSEEADA